MNQVHNYSLKAADMIKAAAGKVAYASKAVYQALLDARQSEANSRIVPLIRHEYPRMSDYEILQELNAKTRC